MSKFKVGDTVRRVKGWNGAPQRIGYVGKIESISEADEDRWLNFKDGSRGLEGSFELIESAGPVRTETVTKRRIVPGVYGRLGVRGAGENTVSISLVDHMGEAGKGAFIHFLSATELDDLAMVASQLAEALRDGLD